MLLVLRYWREGLIGVLVIVLMAACHARDSSLKAEGLARERSRVADSTLQAIRPAMARVDTLLVHDTVRVKRLVTTVTTLRDTVLRNIHDTLLVQQFVTKADSAAHACTELSNDCQAFRAFATQKIAALESKVNAAPLTKPTHHFGSDVLKISAGVAAGWFAHRGR